MNYIIFGGTGFIGTHLVKLIKEKYPDAKVWNLDVVHPDKMQEAHGFDAASEALRLTEYFEKAVKEQTK